jgi:hypothetical protein
MLLQHFLMFLLLLLHELDGKLFSYAPSLMSKMGLLHSIPWMDCQLAGPSNGIPNIRSSEQRASDCPTAILFATNSYPKVDDHSASLSTCTRYQVIVEWLMRITTPCVPCGNQNCRWATWSLVSALVPLSNKHGNCFYCFVILPFFFLYLLPPLELL